MDFQGHQETAQQSTFKLVALFVAGVVAIMVIVAAFVSALFFYDSQEVDPLAAFVVAAPITILGIGGTSLVKSSQIRGGGGAYIASSLGGRQIDFNTLDPVERQLGNVVEEMAIASGMPVPDVFVLDDEPGINAFAAGWSADTAAIGVTRGALNHLNRRELQGVIAHEFSHIRNGDTRIKTRIIGWVFGITVITLLGRLLLQHTLWAPRRRSSKDNSAMVIILVGGGLMLIGALGTLFGRMIQAAVSRQREYLADASAVQYTRDPTSIGEALVKIASVGSQNRIRTAHATEASHLFFSSALGSTFATHPPLKERIKRLMPDWNGELAVLDDAYGESVDDTTLAAVPLLSPSSPSGAVTASAVAGGAVAGGAVAARYEQPSLGGPTDRHVEHSRALIAQIPTQTQSFLRTPQGAVAAVLGSLVSSNPQVRARELDELGRFLSMYPADLAAASETISSLARPLQLPAIDVALHAIRQTPRPYRDRLAKAIHDLEASHQDQDLFRWVLRRVMLRHIEDQGDDGADRKQAALQQLTTEATQVLAILAYFNSSGSAQTQTTFEAALQVAGLPTAQMPSNESLTYDRLDDALGRLADLDPPSRRTFVEAATKVVLYDGTATPDEVELLRVVADAVRVPVPPLLPAT